MDEFEVKDMDTEANRPLDRIRLERSDVENRVIDELVTGKVSRRQFIRSATLIGMSLPLVGAIIEACGTSSPPSSTNFAGQSLTVTIYGGTWQQSIEPGVIAHFEKDTGAKVVKVVGTDTDWFAKLRASAGHNPPYDVAILLPQEIIPAVAAGLIQPIDTSRISNWANVNQSLVNGKNAGNVIDGKVYGVPFAIGQHGYGYRSDKLKTPPASVFDLWTNPALKGHIAFPPLTVNGGLYMFVALVNAMGGQLSNPTDIQAAFAKLRELKGSVSAKPSSPQGIQQALIDGSAWICDFADGNAIALKKQGLPIDFAYLKEGSITGTSPWVLPTGAANLPLSYKFLDYATNPQDQLVFAQHNYYGMSNNLVDYGDLPITAGPKQYSTLVYPDRTVINANLTAWQQQWDAIFS